MFVAGPVRFSAIFCISLSITGIHAAGKTFSHDAEAEVEATPLVDAFSLTKTERIDEVAVSSDSLRSNAALACAK